MNKQSFKIINPEEIPSQVGHNGDIMMEFDHLQHLNEGSNWPEMQVDELSTIRPWMADDHGPVFGGHGSDTLFAEASTCFTSNLIKDKSTLFSAVNSHTDFSTSKVVPPAFVDTDGSSEEPHSILIESAFDPLTCLTPASKACHQTGFITPSCRDPESCPQRDILLQASSQIEEKNMHHAPNKSSKMQQLASQGLSQVLSQRFEKENLCT